ncbi:MAG: hypothetical protein IT424_06425 [Pirellulales bacterium]|nr:hypothetical protein [Pirellulales bacterium]
MAAPQLSPKQPAAPKRPTRALLDRYVSLRDRRLELSREAASLEREEKALAEEIQAFAAAEGGKRRTVELCGYRASITTAAGYVSWAKEFTRVAGFEAAERLRREAPPVDRLKVEKL